MTLESISIEGFKSQSEPQQDQFPSVIVSPVVHQSNGLPALQNFLRRMNEAGLFGQDLIQRYFAHLYRNCRSRQTIRSYQTILFAFLVFLKSNGRQHIETVSREDICAYVEYEQDRGMRATTVECKARGIYCFYRFLVDRDIVHPKILTRKIRIKTPEPLPRAIDPEDIQSLLRVITHLRDRTLILVLLRTGMRIGELLRTKLLDLNLSERRIEIFEAQKSRVGRVVYICDDALSALTQWLEQRKQDSDYVFYGHRGRMLSYEAARTMFTKYLTKASLAHKGYTLHALRHTYASELLKAGMRLDCLQQLLGHSSIEMTRRYARLTDNTRREEYFKAMQIIESGGIHGHYRRHCPLPQVS